MLMMTVPTSFFNTFLLYLLIIGSGCNGGDEPIVDGNRIFYTGNNSLVGNIASSVGASTTFQGFDFTADPIIPGGGISNDEWAWVVDVSDVDVGHGSIVSQTTHTLRFPLQKFPYQNETNWTACAYTFTNDFPQNLTSQVTTNDGTCTEIFGRTCLADIINSLQDARDYFYCANMWDWIQLSVCKAQFGTEDALPHVFTFSELSSSYIPLLIH